MATINKKAEITYTLLKEGPTDENVTVEPVSGELELVISEGTPEESLRGHQRYANKPLSTSLKTGESLYGRSSGNNPITVVIT